jgi:hypothetical protein
LRFAVIGLIVLLAACGGQPTASGVPTTSQLGVPTQPPEATAAPQPTQPPAATAAPQPTAMPAATVEVQTPAATPHSNGNTSAVLLILHISGGIAGISDTMTVYSDGRLELIDRKGEKTAKVAPSELATLQKLLASPEFAALEPQYQAPVADAFIYQLTVPGGSQPRAVVTMDGVKNPAVLDQVLIEVNRLRKQVAG